MAQIERMLIGVGHRLGDATVKLNDIADGKSPGFRKLALEAGKKVAEGKGPVRGALELGGSRLKEKVTDAVKGVGGGKRKKGGAGKKPTVILEYVDVGVPVREAYDQWTQYQEFSTFAKGVEDATVASDTDIDWKLKVFWSKRSWKAHTTEQVPDQRITWTSEGAKGTAKGAVTFHPLAENLTRVLLVIEYYPQGLFEKTGNIWRAQGRRARLDLKHFARHITLRGEASDGWRGEIRDGEVVRSHEDAVADEESEDERPEAEYDEDHAYEEDGEDREDAPEAEYEDEDEGEPEEELDEPEAEYDEEAEEEADEPEPEPEDEPEAEYDEEADGEVDEDEVDEETDDEPEDETDVEPEDEVDEEADVDEEKRREYAGSADGGRDSR
nr:SRPBCC family protein [Streptomyces sp. NRRL S-920]